jgi:hypothetical protein
MSEEKFTVYSVMEWNYSDSRMVVIYRTLEKAADAAKAFFMEEYPCNWVWELKQDNDTEWTLTGNEEGKTCGADAVVDIKAHEV